MQPVSPEARRYDGMTMVFHWLTALLVATQWLGAQTIDWFPRGALRVDARSLHITMGVLLALILAARIAWRLTAGRRLPLADHGLLSVLAKATHWVLYGLVALMLVLGVTLAWVRGDSIFNLFSIPSFAPGDRALIHQVQEWHADVGWAIIVVAGVHSCAALFHRIVWRDGVLARMLPGD